MCLREISRLVSQGDLRTHSVQLSGELHGFVYKSKKGKVHIFIDNSLSPATTTETLLHEGCHVTRHIDQKICVLGINDINNSVEEEADSFANKNINLHQNENFGCRF